ncbi:ABC transporter permease [Micromonospora sp. NPDC048830]|uniref:ABC transporter permease n=1 Tax=Micromonospora sp. NPDC048830 TaxID=3364257 RepID=UPI003715F45A
MSTTVPPTTRRSAQRGGLTGGLSGGLRGAVASEWTKLWSVRSVWWNLLASALLMAAAAGQEAIYVVNENTNTDPADDPGVTALGAVAISSVLLAQFTVIALAMLVITAEYATGTIRATLQWTPSRGRVLLAKTAVVAAVTFVVGALLGALGSAVADPVLGEWGRFPVAETVGDVLAVATYLALISVFTLGVGTALRSAVGTLTTVFMIIMVVPTALGVLDNEFVNRIVDGLPGVAGYHFMRGGSDPYPPAVGLALLVAWAVAAMLAGYAALRSRDA